MLTNGCHLQVKTLISGKWTSGLNGAEVNNEVSLVQGRDRCQDVPCKHFEETDSGTAVPLRAGDMK